MRIPPELKELFSFSATERNGLIVLFVIVLTTSFISVYVKQGINAEFTTADTSLLSKEISEFRNSLKEKENPEYISRLDKFIIQKYDSIELFKFDPNTVTKEEWLKLGLSEKQTKNIMNFRAKGGKFYDKNDFRRMYGIRTRQYLILEPYIMLPERYYVNNYNSYKSKFNNSSYDKDVFTPDSLFKFNPNTATDKELEALGLSQKQAKNIINYRKKSNGFKTKSDLKKIYSIGDEEYAILEDYIDLPENISSEKRKKQEVQKKKQKVDINTFSEQDFKQLEEKFWQYNARKIVKYRNLLGGYVHPDQLLELRGMKKHFYEKVKNQITPIKQKPKLININFASEKEFAAHPYIKKYDAEAIVKFRDHNGAFKKISDLRKHKLISETNYKKLKPYLIVR